MADIVMYAVRDYLKSKNINDRIVSYNTILVSASDGESYFGANCYVSFLVDRVSVKCYYSDSGSNREIFYSDPNLFDNVLNQIRERLLEYGI